MLTSKQRAELRAQANTLDTVLIVGKSGVTDSVLAEAEILLESKELVKGRVLETALLTAREVSDQICEKTGADGIQTVGSKFVIYRKSKKKEQEAQQKAARLRKKEAAYNPVRAGVQRRRKLQQEEREKKNQYFKEAAVQASIERSRQKKKQDT